MILNNFCVKIKFINSMGQSVEVELAQVDIVQLVIPVGHLLGNLLTLLEVVLTFLLSLFKAHEHAAVEV